MKDKIKKHLSVLGKINPVKAAIFLSIFLFLFILIVERPGSFESNQKKSERFLIPQMKVETVTKIDILVSGDEDIVFRKTDDVWAFGDEDSALLSIDMVNEFLGKVYDLKEELVVSNNPEKQSLYAVDDRFGFHIVLWEGDSEVADFYVGKITGLNSQYLRLNGSNEVLQITPVLLNPSEFSVEDFRG